MALCSIILQLPRQIASPDLFHISNGFCAQSGSETGDPEPDIDLLRVEEFLGLSGIEARSDDLEDIIANAGEP